MGNRIEWGTTAERPAIYGPGTEFSGYEEPVTDHGILIGGAGAFMVEGTPDQLAEWTDNLARKVRTDLADKLTKAKPADGTRVVTIEGPGGVRYTIPISGDQTVTFLVDGQLAAGVDVDGLGYWPDGSRWQRLPVDQEQGLVPIVKFDVDLLRAWVVNSYFGGECNVDAGWAPVPENVAELVQEISDDDDQAGAGWVLHPDVERVFSSTLDDGDVVFGADMRPSGRIATLPQDHKHLRDSEGRMGVDAAIEALTYVAALLDRAYGH